MNKAKELREMSDEQLDFNLKEAQESMFRLRFQAATEKLDTPSQIKRTRRQIARIKTIQSERALAKALS